MKTGRPKKHYKKSCRRKLSTVRIRWKKVTSTSNSSRRKKAITKNRWFPSNSRPNKTCRIKTCSIKSRMNSLCRRLMKLTRNRVRSASWISTSKSWRTTCSSIKVTTKLLKRNWTNRLRVWKATRISFSTSTSRSMKSSPRPRARSSPGSPAQWLWGSALLLHRSAWSRPQPRLSNHLFRRSTRWARTSSAPGPDPLRIYTLLHRCLCQLLFQWLIKSQQDCNLYLNRCAALCDRRHRRR